MEQGWLGHSSPSVDLFSFVRRCQTAVGEWTERQDRVTRFLVIVGLVGAAPRETVGLERAVAALVIARFAARLTDDRFVETPREPLREIPSGEAVKKFHVQRAIESMLARTASSPTLRDLAEEEGLSSSYLSRLLKSETGFGFEELIHGARIVKALLLVRNPTLRIKEIAAQAGFRTTGELDRQFGRAFGVTPSELRRTVIATGNTPSGWR